MAKRQLEEQVGVARQRLECPWCGLIGLCAIAAAPRAGKRNQAERAEYGAAARARQALPRPLTLALCAAKYS
jgi:hypothetical protein